MAEGMFSSANSIYSMLCFLSFYIQTTIFLKTIYENQQYLQCEKEFLLTKMKK